MSDSEKPQVPSEIGSKQLSNRSELDHQAHTFLQKLETDLNEFDLQIRSNWFVDHLCYRASSDQEYQELKDFFGEQATLLAETPVNGRMISSYRFSSGFQFRSQMIEIIELPAPKPGKPTRRGFEHVEIVIDQSFEEFEAALPKALKLRVARKGLSKAFNPELELELLNVNIKFHHQSLAEVCRWELNPQVSFSLDWLAQVAEVRGSELLVVHENEILIYGPKINRDSVDKAVVEKFKIEFAKNFGEDFRPPLLKFENRSEEFTLLLKRS